LAEFLSSAWIAELDEAASALTGAVEDAGVTIEQRIQDAPAPLDPEVRYHLKIAPATVRVVPGPAAAPDVIVTTDYETARAIHEGHTTAQAALAEGRYKLRGRLAATSTFAGLDDVFRAVRDRTTFPERPTIEP
jgi:SCP-2 sterol transfer family